VSDEPERSLDAIFRSAVEIARVPDAARPAAAIPALVCDSLETLDPRRVCLVIHHGHPVTVWPKGLRPVGSDG
jgi:hypothetical protein